MENGAFRLNAIEATLELFEDVQMILDILQAGVFRQCFQHRRNFLLTPFLARS